MSTVLPIGMVQQQQRASFGTTGRTAFLYVMCAVGRAGLSSVCVESDTTTVGCDEAADAIQLVLLFGNYVAAWPRWP